MEPLVINKSKVKKLAEAAALDRARSGGRHFTRVGKSFYEAIDAIVRQSVVNRVKSAPSKGVTLQ